MTNTINALSVIPLDAPERVKEAALSGLSANSCRAYTRHLDAFLSYMIRYGQPLTRETVLHYLTRHKDDTSTHNQALSAIKRLAEQAAENNWLDWSIVRSISTIPSKKLRGSHSGSWLTLPEARALLSSPDPTTPSGKRDRAVLALLLGCGLRREELAHLQLGQLTFSDNRPILANVKGKHDRVRSIAIPSWAYDILTDWLQTLPPSSPNGPNGPTGLMFRSFSPNRDVNGSLGATAIWTIVQEHSAKIGIPISPHDLRRTYAKLARKGGASIEVIQRSLGHSSITTTQRYMNTGEESNAGDFMGL